MSYYNRDPAYVPSQQALAADAYIKSTSPETHPDEYTYYPMYGYTYTGPMAHYTTGTEYASWINSSMGDSMFGSGQQVANSQNNNPYIQSINVQALLDAFPDAQDTATYLSETNFPNLNPNQVGTVSPIGPAPESSSSGTTNINTNDAVVPPLPPPPPPPPPTEAAATATTSTIPLAGFPEFEEQAQTQNNNTGGGLTPEILAALLNAFKPPPRPLPPPPKTGVAVGSSGGAFSPFQVQGMGYSSGNLSNISNSGNKVDYVNSLREGLSNSLFKGLL